MSDQTNSKKHEHGSFALLAPGAGLLPVTGINCAYALVAVFETVPRCFLYIHGCTSISSTGQRYSSVWIFKPLMFASAVVMAVFSRRWHALPDSKPVADATYLCSRTTS